MTLSEWFLFFIGYAFIGWTIEVIGVLINQKKFVNRGFLIGPYCPIYGFGGVIMTLTLTKYFDHPITLFAMGMFECAILEYFTSYAMEKLFNARWWDYTKYKYNINGRICLETMIPFGLLGCVAIYIVNPILNKWLGLMPLQVINILAITTAAIFFVDILVSVRVIDSFKRTAMQFKNKDNTEEITKKVKAVLSTKSPFTKRLVDAFPNLRAAIANIKNELIRTRRELKNTRKELKSANKKLDKVQKKMKKYKK